MIALESLLLKSHMALAEGINKIAFSIKVDSHLEIVVTDENGENMVNLSANHKGGIQPAWSPDGKLIAFASMRDGNYQIYVMDSDGSNQRRITNNPAVDMEPSFAPDGRRLTFTRRPADELLKSETYRYTSKIYITDIYSQDEKLLTDDGRAAKWSPDGKKIAFCRKKSADELNWDVYLMDADGNHQENITKHSSSSSDPDWSPDGKQIVFRSSRGGANNIYKMDADGQNVVRLTNKLQVNETAPAWSPDGQYIVYYNMQEQHEINVIRADGGEPKIIAEGAYPSWFNTAFAR